jgi:hypothetical protein
VSNEPQWPRRETRQDRDLLQWQVARPETTVSSAAISNETGPHLRLEPYWWIPSKTSQLWMQGVCTLGLRALRAACIIRGLAGRQRSRTVQLKPRALEREGWRLDRRGLNRGLYELERKGFLDIKSSPGKPLTVMILDPPRVPTHHIDAYSSGEGGDVVDGETTRKCP